jgi:(+)-trans-carveol dehydrogenase
VDVKHLKPMGMLDDKVALVTGAARGQGRSHALRLAQEGADIIAVDICADIATVPYALASPSDLADTAEAVKATGRRVVTYEADVRAEAVLGHAVSSGVEALGRLDVVVANAGVLSLGDVTTLDGVEWRDVIDVNLTGVWNTLKASLPHLRDSGGGSVVNISSVNGTKAYAGIAHYVAAKHGVIGLTKAAALELAGEAIRVNAVLPTNVDTPMIHNDALYRRLRPELRAPSAEDIIEPMLGMQEMPVPWLSSADVSEAVLFLASPASRHVTGISLPVDLGASLK